MTAIEARTILLVDDEERFRVSMADWLQSLGYAVIVRSSAHDALPIVEDGGFALAILDMWMPGADGLELLQRIKASAPEAEVVVLTGGGTMETAIQALKLGAFDYLLKPVEPERMENVLRQAFEKHRLAQLARSLERQVADLSTVRTLVGRSAGMQMVHERVSAASRSRGTVLIRGETGTGKELVARAIHELGCTPGQPFVPVNCAALPRDLIEAELFGHRKGAFTNAEVESAGLFRAAAGGTLFLDEVTEMPPDTQAKLLRVLQERRIRPVGSTTEIPVELRVVASTNRDPQAAVREGKLREDLYFRLAVATITVPPLRERREDIPLLVRHFVDKFRKIHGRDVTGVERPALAALAAHHWPGNVRELENVVEQAFMFGRSDEILVTDLPPQLVDKPPARGDWLRADDVLTLADAQRLAIQYALDRVNGNRSQAAVALGISRKHLYARMSALGMPVQAKKALTTRGADDVEP